MQISSGCPQRHFRVSMSVTWICDDLCALSRAPDEKGPGLANCNAWILMVHEQLNYVAICFENLPVKPASLQDFTELGRRSAASSNACDFMHNDTLTVLTEMHA